MKRAIETSPISRMTKSPRTESALNCAICLEPAKQAVKCKICTMTACGLCFTKALNQSEDSVVMHNARNFELRPCGPCPQCKSVLRENDVVPVLANASTPCRCAHCKQQIDGTHFFACPVAQVYSCSLCINNGTTVEWFSGRELQRHVFSNHYNRTLTRMRNVLLYTVGELVAMIEQLENQARAWGPEALVAMP